MKKIIAIVTLLISLSAFPSAITGWTLYLSMTTTYPNAFDKEAAQIINDSQELMQTGNITAFLLEKIRIVQAKDSSLSDSEALDILLSVSSEVLK